MPPQEISTGLAGAISGIGGLVGGIANIGSTLLANRANRKLAEYSFEQQRNMIQEQNEYNSPKSQMARYEEAGLNPHMLYGAGQNAAGNQSSIAKYEAPTMQAPDVNMGINEALNMALNYRMSTKELELRDAQIATQKAMASNYQEDALGKRINNALSTVINGFGVNLSPEARKGIESSRAIGKYDLGMQSERLTQGLTRARTEYQNLNNYERRFFNNYLLPLSLELKKLEIEGYGYENAKRKIDSELWRDLRFVEMQSNPFKVASHLGLLFGRSPVGAAWRDSMNEILTDPIGWKNNPIKRTFDYAKDWWKNRKK